MRLMAKRLEVALQRIGFHVTGIVIIDMLRFAPFESSAMLSQRLAAVRAGQAVRTAA